MEECLFTGIANTVKKVQDISNNDISKLTDKKTRWKSILSYKTMIWKIYEVSWLSSSEKNMLIQKDPEQLTNKIVSCLIQA